MRTVLALILCLLTAPAMAQTWQCFSGSVACAPGSPNCTCTQVAQPPAAVLAPAPAVPSCPVMTFWNGVTCQVPAAPPVDMSYYFQQQLLQQQMQQQRQMEWQREQWRAQHPDGDHGDHH
jgi:hypothetical protein